MLEIERTGADVVVLVLPVTSAYVDAHPDGDADIDAFRRALDRAVSATDAKVIEAPASSDAEFADTQHLNGAGADRLSSLLPRLLDSAGIAPRSCAP